METLNINAVEMVNNTVKLNNTVMGNIEELTKVFRAGRERIEPPCKTQQKRSCNSSTAESS